VEPAGPVEPISSVDPIETETLDAPTGLVVENVTTSTAELSWTAVEGAEKYNVVIDDGASVEVTDITCLAEGLRADTEHTWQVQAVKGTIFSDWAKGDAFTTAAAPVTPVPTGLAASAITHNGATLSGQHTDADYHEVRVGDREFTSVDKPIIRVKDLASNRSYSWRVRSNKDGVWSKWAEGVDFKTNVDDGMEQFACASVEVYRRDYKMMGTDEFLFSFSTFDPATGDINGADLLVNFIFGYIMEPSEAEIDLPEGKYPVVEQVYQGGIIHGGNYGGSTMWFLDNGEPHGGYWVTGGSATISGDRTNYTILFDITYLDGLGGRLKAKYVGPLTIENPYRGM
jgi:hypothetical protein